MSNQSPERKRKYDIRDVYTKTNKDGTSYDVMQIQPSTSSPPCKQCRAHPREAGSSRCGKCRTQHGMRKINDFRLSEKIRKQISN